MGGDKEAYREDVGSRLEICPSCNSRSYYTFEFEKTVLDSTRILVYGGVCRRCGYRTYNTLELGSKPPVKIVVEVDCIEALNSLLYRGKRASIKIPELGIEIYPSTYSDPYITTIEGVLYRVLEVLEAASENLESQIMKERIREAIDGKVKFTLIIEDPEGTSKFVPKDPEKVKYKISKLEV